MKNIKVIILIIVLLIIMVGSILIVYTNSRDIPISEKNIAYPLEENTTSFNETNSVNNNENIIGNINETNSFNTNIIEGNFKIVEVDENSFKNNYTIEEPFDIINEEYFNIEKENSTLTISLIQSDRNKELLGDIKEITYNQKYIINNVNAEEVTTIFCGGEGQDLMYPVVYLLLNNGTVKGVDIEAGYNTGTFNAETIYNLENVQKIEQADVAPPNDSGYVAVVATTEDGKVFEIRKEEKIL